MATTYTHIAQNKWRSLFILAIFISFVLGIAYVFAAAYHLYWLFPFAILFVSFQGVASYWWSDKLVLGISGAKEVNKNENLDLYRIVENEAITAGLPTPRIYIIEDSAPNAFATGRDPKHAVIAVTRGLLGKLNKPELEGVIAHEFSHIGNYDIRLQTMVVVLVGIVVLLSDWFLRISIFGGDDNNDNQWLVIVGLILAILSPIFAYLLQLSLSRNREFLADADGALLTRNPEGLASALEKITADKEPLEAANKATAHLYFANPLKDHEGKRAMFSGLFDTHPDPAERIRRLREMAM